MIKVDLFISNYVCDYFPLSKLKSYIHHDIYDTPLSNLSEEKNLKNRLNKYDHILKYHQVIRDFSKTKTKKIWSTLKLDIINLTF